VIVVRTLNTINKLPNEKAKEIADYSEVVSRRFKEQEFLKYIEQIDSKSETFRSLKDEEDIYNISDSKELYND
jgi:hypothetical protein